MAQETHEQEQRENQRPGSLGLAKVMLVLLRKHLRRSGSERSA